MSGGHSHGDEHGNDHGHGHHNHNKCCGGSQCGHCFCCRTTEHHHYHEKKCESIFKRIARAIKALTIAIQCTIAFSLQGIIAFTIGISLFVVYKTYFDPPPSEPDLWCEQNEPAPVPAQRSDSYRWIIGELDLSTKATATGDAALENWLTESPKREELFSSQIHVGLINSATELAIAESGGSPFAAPILNNLHLSPMERQDELWDFWNESDKDGVQGFFRLGQTFLGPDAFVLAAASPSNTRLYVPFCRNTKSKFVPFHDVKASYLYFAMVDQQCQVPGKPPAKDWLNAIKKYYPEYEAQFPTWDSTAKLYFNSLMRKHGQDPEDDNAQDYFCIGTYAPPVDCERADKSRQALKYGDAASAEGDKEKARVCWRKAIELATESNDGKPPVDPEGATAAIIAQKRLQTNETTCKTSADGLAAISRDYKARSGDLIHVRVLQQALRALGHYEGNLDGELSPQTRAAIRKFQREREEDETDTLTPEQNVSLICSAAETSRDLVSETTLGIMYATGLGVEQNMDRAQYWLMQASNQHYADATYNLAVLYGTGIILDSYRLCDVPRAPEQADKYLQEAASQGQPIAVALEQRYGPGSTYANLSPRERWTLIEMQQLESSAADKTGLYAHRLANIGTKCAPDRSIR